MARRPRLQYPGATYHVMSRGNRKKNIFEGDLDRQKFLETLGRALKRHGVLCLEYCLMDTHYHLVLRTPHGNLSDVMQYLIGVFTQWSNRQYNRTGHLFEGRFVSLIVQDLVYLRDVAKYIVTNPLKAGLTNDVADWRWSSYRATAGLDPAPSFLHCGWLEEVFPGDSLLASRERYKRFVCHERVSLVQPDPAMFVLGDSMFEQHVRNEIELRTVRELPKAYLALGRPPLSQLVERGAQRTRGQQCLRAHVVYGYKISEIAAFLGLHRTTVGRAVRSAQGMWLLK